MVWLAGAQEGMLDAIPEDDQLGFQGVADVVSLDEDDVSGELQPL
jgi:hypothetical protein